MGIAIVSPPYVAHPGDTVTSTFGNNVIAFAWGIWGFTLSYDTDYDMTLMSIAMETVEVQGNEVSVRVQMQLQDSSNNRISLRDSSLYPVCIAVTGSPMPDVAVSNVSGISSQVDQHVTLPNQQSGYSPAASFLSGMNFAYDKGNHGILSTLASCGLSYAGSDGDITGTATLTDGNSEQAQTATLDAGYVASSYPTPILGIEPVQQQTNQAFDVTMTQLSSVSNVVAVITGWKIVLDHPRHIQSITVGAGIPYVKAGNPSNVVTVPSLYASIKDSHGERQDNALSPTPSRPGLIIAQP